MAMLAQQINPTDRQNYAFCRPLNSNVERLSFSEGIENEISIQVLYRVADTSL